jgi:hypothetical protein
VSKRREAEGCGYRCLIEIQIQTPGNVSRELLLVDFTHCLLLTYSVISRQCSNSVALGAKRT